MKKLVKLIIAILCLCMVTSSSACGKAQTIGEITSKLSASGYQMYFYNNYSTANTIFQMFKFEDEYNAIRAEKLSGSTKKILVLSLRSEADFNLAINERERVASSYFGGPCVYITSGMTIIFGSDESALDDVNNESYDKDLAKIVDNLISNGYRLDYDRSLNKDYNVLEARKSVNILGITKSRTIKTYIFSDKNILNSYYDECIDYYQEEIEKGDLILEKKGKLLVVADSESVIKDALGR